MTASGIPVRVRRRAAVMRGCEADGRPIRTNGPFSDGAAESGVAQAHEACAPCGGALPVRREEGLTPRERQAGGAPCGRVKLDQSEGLPTHRQQQRRWPAGGAFTPDHHPDE